MAMAFERVLTEGIAQLSYLIGDDRSATAAVIDPRPDCEIYLELAHKLGLGITHIFETHIHADFLSGVASLPIVWGSGRGPCTSVAKARPNTALTIVPCATEMYLSLARCC